MVCGVVVGRLCSNGGAILTLGHFFFEKKKTSHSWSVPGVYNTSGVLCSGVCGGGGSSDGAVPTLGHFLKDLTPLVTPKCLQQ